ncbi:hypothetical protein KA977_05505 [Candidatus Dependentiae bacterium]|nr:hypothetical protein [Candidatus Dependentiae bacterium]
MKEKSRKKIIEINIGIIFIVAAIGILFVKNIIAVIAAAVLFCFGLILFLFEKMDDEEIDNEELSESLKDTGFESGEEEGQSFEFTEDKTDGDDTNVISGESFEEESSPFVDEKGSDSTEFASSGSDIDFTTESEDSISGDNISLGSGEEEHEKDFLSETTETESTDEKYSEPLSNESEDGVIISEKTDDEEIDSGLEIETQQDFDDSKSKTSLEEESGVDSELTDEIDKLMGKFEDEIETPEEKKYDGMQEALADERQEPLAPKESLIDESAAELEKISRSMPETDFEKNAESSLPSEDMEDIDKLLAETNIEGLGIDKDIENKDFGADSVIDDVEKLLGDLKTGEEEQLKSDKEISPENNIGNDEDFVKEYKSTLISSDKTGDDIISDIEKEISEVENMPVSSETKTVLSQDEFSDIDKQIEGLSDLNELKKELGLDSEIEEDLKGLDDLLKETNAELGKDFETGTEIGSEKTQEAVQGNKSDIDELVDEEKPVRIEEKPLQPKRKSSKEPITTDILTELLNEGEDDKDINEELDELDELLKSDEESFLGEFGSEEKKSTLKVKEELSAETKKMEEDVLKILEM